MKATIRHVATLATVVLGLGVTGAGCLTRPVAPGTPVTKTNVTIPVPNQSVKKIDMLFDIDNSASMGDKQAYLADAIPLLITRLVQPNCVNTATPPVVNGQVDANGDCPTGFQAEFPPVTDMHIGVVTSSLGMRLSNVGVQNGAMTATTPDLVLCNPATPTAQYPNVSAHNDDNGELITRSETTTGGTLTEGTVNDATPNGYLYYFPKGTTTDTQPPVTAPATLETDFTSLVTGAGIYGCGIESQLESWYRFLIQPDPYGSLALVKASNGQYYGSWADVDTTIIQERHDFLRPDSLVVVVVLTDENDSEIDVRSLQGTGYLFMHEDFDPPHGTSACATNPDSANCYNCSAGNNDPNCTANGGIYNASNDWGFDPNLRHVHMQQKYGVDPQYPIARYYLGLTNTVVPDRNGEYPMTNGVPAGSYQGCLPSTTNPGECIPNCTNPLFAATLPDKNSPQTAASYCNLPLGQRANQKTNIFYAHIGGVPWQLLHFDPTNLENSKLNMADWKRILGAGAAAYDLSMPLTHDYTGIDPHMIESYQDRTTLNPAPTTDSSMTNALAPSSGAPAAPDPVSGREWVTDQPVQSGMNDAQGLPIGHVLPVDRQYACTFKLAQARDCTAAANSNSCDCPADATGLTPAQIPPLCDPANPTSQIYAKAYPTIRELTVANLMGTQGIVASLCPIDTTPAPGLTMASDPKYGYNPAVAVIVDRLKDALNNPCLPQKLGTTGDAGSAAVPCLVLVQLPSNGGTCTKPVCDNTNGLFGPGQATNSADNPPLEQEVLDNFCAGLEQQYIAGHGTPGALGDPASQSVCMLYQLTSDDPNQTEIANGSCSSYNPPVNTTTPGNGGGWCYVTGTAAKGCAQAVQFSANLPPAGSVTYLQCIEQSISVVNASSGTSM